MPPYLARNGAAPGFVPLMTSRREPAGQNVAIRSPARSERRLYSWVWMYGNWGQKPGGRPVVSLCTLLPGYRRDIQSGYRAARDRIERAAEIKTEGHSVGYVRVDSDSTLYV